MCAGVAASGEIGAADDWPDDPEPPPRTSSQTTNATSAATAITAPIRTSGLRAQAERVRWFTATKDRFRLGAHRPARLQSDLPRAVSSVGRAPARQAGGHWFEPSTAHSTEQAETRFARRV